VRFEEQRDRALAREARKRDLAPAKA
jgi:hypothetical protein